ncbi:hypothetical protein, partial [Planktothrix sp.]
QASKSGHASWNFPQTFLKSNHQGYTQLYIPDPHGRNGKDDLCDNEITPEFRNHLKISQFFSAVIGTNHRINNS